MYISGPILGHEYEERKRRFLEAQRALACKGFVGVNPFENGCGRWESVMTHTRANLIAMLRCEGVLMLDGWEESAGATTEHEVARLCGIHVFYGLDEVEVDE